jgi:rhodanese-related sulfurtransferase
MNKYKVAAALALLMAAVGLALVGQPSAAEKLARMQPQLDAKLASEELRLDPGELFDMTQNNQLRLVLLDLRSESDYNLFHITDARRTQLAELEQPWLAQLTPETVIIVMSNDELMAQQAWLLLAAQGIRNVYILGGGVNLWLTIYKDGITDAPLPQRDSGDDSLRHAFSAALGADQPAAHPDPLHTPKRAFTAKLKMAGAVRKAGGGCG